MRLKDPLFYCDIFKEKFLKSNSAGLLNIGASVSWNKFIDLDWRKVSSCEIMGKKIDENNDSLWDKGYLHGSFEKVNSVKVLHRAQSYGADSIMDIIMDQ